MASMHSLDDFERAAEERMASDAWDFVSGGSGRELTVAANRTALDRVRIVPRVLAGSTEPAMTVSLLGSPADLPLATAPMAYQRWFHPDGELAVARAAAAHGVPFVLSMMGSRTIEEVTETGATTWLQLYWLRDREVTLDLVRRAEAAGVAALMLTVDLPVMARRLRDLRRGLTVPGHLSAVNLPPGDQGSVPGGGPLRAESETLFDGSLSFDDVAWLRSRTSLPLVVKGVLAPEDAVRAAEAGVDAVVVSNHGGRQLDGAVATATALPAVRQALGDRCAVLMDGGIRHGADVLKALALGADAVLVGRPVLWGLGVGGAPGVREVLGLLRTELEETMILAGCKDVGAARGLKVVA
ncbi:alpha-hydroxy acid oxidase [Streptomyces sp. JJ38]|uniref:alpha-hydroxy acid oxidase n=1 Tax=Streptomyces sp. JJ38 TaxID=2738128 RepID=UPI00214AB380|nr:alpha-hydroxy acid oxidase [Streptomyces sp. JJ38]